MTDKVENTTNEATTEATTEEPKKEFTADPAALLSELNKLKDINKEAFAARDSLKAKLKEYEDKAEQDRQALLSEQGKFKELYESEKQSRTALEQRIRDNTVESALKEALAAAGAVSVPTALKVADRSTIKLNEDGTVDADSLKAVLSTVKKEHEVLFAQPKKPTPEQKDAKHDVSPSTSYMEALKALRANPRATPHDLALLRRKFGKE